MTAMKPLFFYLKCVWVCHVNLNSYNFLLIIGISEKFEDIKGVVNRYTGCEICAEGGKAKFPKKKEKKKNDYNMIDCQKHYANKCCHIDACIIILKKHMLCGIYIVFIVIIVWCCC